jgi:hypothetical protein
MSLKIHFLHFPLDFFLKNLGDVSDEQDERFHDDQEKATGEMETDFSAATAAGLKEKLQIHARGN